MQHYLANKLVQHLRSISILHMTHTQPDPTLNSDRYPLGGSRSAGGVFIYLNGPMKGSTNNIGVALHDLFASWCCTYRACRTCFLGRCCESSIERQNTCRTSSQPCLGVPLRYLCVYDHTIASPVTEMFCDGSVQQYAGRPP